MLVIFNSKGGVGKSSNAFSIAKDLKMSIITNDTSIISNVYDDTRYIDKKMPIEKGTMYDLGGFTTRYITDILDVADLVIVPVNADYNALLKGLEVIKYVGYKRCLVIANMIETKKDLEEIEEVIKNEYKKISILPLKRSRAFKNGLENGKSINDISSAGLGKHNYKSLRKQYSEIIKYIKENS